jgi:hypothetical protein
MRETDFLWQPMKVIGNGCFGKVGPHLCIRVLSLCISCLILFGAKSLCAPNARDSMVGHTPVTLWLLLTPGHDGQVQEEREDLRHEVDTKGARG